MIPAAPAAYSVNGVRAEPAVDPRRTVSTATTSQQSNSHTP